MYEFERTIDNVEIKSQLIKILKKTNQLNQLSQRMMLILLNIYIAGLLSSDALANCTRPIKVPIPALNSSSINAAGEIKKGNFSTNVIQLMDGLGKNIECKFSYLLVPKARQEFLFKNGDADLLFMVTQTPKRDEYGQLISFFKIRPTIISNKNFQSSILKLKDIKENIKIQLVLVKDFDYGDEYQELIALHVKQKRVSYEQDSFSVARMMIFNKNVVTIMGPFIFEEVLSAEKVLEPLIGNIRYDELEEFPWLDVGIYISNKSLEEKDINYLKKHLPILLTNDHIWNWIQKKYSNEIVRISFRQLNINSNKK